MRDGHHKCETDTHVSKWKIERFGTSMTNANLPTFEAPSLKFS